ncbi:MAG: hypothetical protein QM811_20120 [Pirellulales bacterium]
MLTIEKQLRGQTTLERTGDDLQRDAATKHRNGTNESLYFVRIERTNDGRIDRRFDTILRDHAVILEAELDDALREADAESLVRRDSARVALAAADGLSSEQRREASEKLDRKSVDSLTQAGAKAGGASPTGGSALRNVPANRSARQDDVRTESSKRESENLSPNLDHAGEKQELGKQLGSAVVSDAEANVRFANDLERGGHRDHQRSRSAADRKLADVETDMEVVVLETDLANFRAILSDLQSAKRSWRSAPVPRPTWFGTPFRFSGSVKTSLRRARSPPARSPLRFTLPTSRFRSPTARNTATFLPPHRAYRRLLLLGTNVRVERNEKSAQANFAAKDNADAAKADASKAVASQADTAKSEPESLHLLQADAKGKGTAGKNESLDAQSLGRSAGGPDSAMDDRRDVVVAPSAVAPMTVPAPIVSKGGTVGGFGTEGTTSQRGLARNKNAEGYAYRLRFDDVEGWARVGEASNAKNSSEPRSSAPTASGVADQVSQSHQAPVAERVPSRRSKFEIK